MAKRSHLWLALAGALLVVAIGVLQRQVGETPGVEDLRGPAAPEDARSEIDEVPGEVQETTEAEHRAPDPGASANQLPSATPGSDRASSHILVCVDARTGTSLPGTEVWIAPGEAIDELIWAEEIPILLHEEAFARELGTRFEANSWGEVVLEPNGAWFFASARFGELWGADSFTATDEWDNELELHVDRELVIEVVDTGGIPRPGIPVALLHESSDGRADYVWEGVTSGDDGRAVIHHFQTRVTGCDEGELFATFGFPPHYPGRARIEKEAPPADPVRLVLADTGSLVVRIEDERGRPWPEDLLVHAWEVEGDDATIRPRFLPESTAYCRNGRAAFSHVGLGLELGVKAYPGGEFGPATQRVQGPRAAGERVEVTLRPEGRYPILTGRLLLPSGEPVIERRVNWSLACGETEVRGPHSGRYFFTNEVGGFRLALREEQPSGSCVLHLEARIDEPEPWIDHALELPLGPGEHELGTLSLRPPSVLIAGSVIDECGRPVELDEVTLLRRERFEEWAQDPSRGELPGVSCLTAANGAFWLCGSPEPGEFVLHSPRLRTDPQILPVTLGDRNVQIEARGGADLRGFVLVDEGVSTDCLVLMIRTTASGGVQYLREGYLDRSGHFQFDNLAACIHEVSIHHEDRDRPPLIEPILVDVVSCETQRPRALQGIDLRGLLHSFRLRVVDRDDQPLSGDIAYVVSGGASEVVVESGFDDGTCTFSSVGLAIDLALNCEGYRLERFSAVDTDLEVVMRPGLDVKLHVRGEVDLPEGLFFAAALQPVEIEGELDEQSLVHRVVGTSWEHCEPLAGGSRAAFLLPAPGTWKLTWLIGESEGGGDWSRIVPPADSSLLVVEDLAAPQELVVPAPIRESIEEAVNSRER